MKTWRFALPLLLILLILGLAGVAHPQYRTSFAVKSQGDGPVTIRVGKLLDGRGGALTDVTVVLDGSRIRAIDRSIDPKPRENPTWDLRGLTLMPGGVDTHV
ncbi:MAG TPA: hypothetical protein VGH73_14510, partial [Thermoanaerobaculia bacterium]